MVEALEGFADVVTAQGEQPEGVQRVVRLYGAGETLCEAIGAPRRTLQQSRLEGVLNAA
jgi:hypothetical protein